MAPTTVVERQAVDGVLRGAGMRATLPRRAVLEMIREDATHWSVDDIRHGLVTRGITLPRSSVNNVLGSLTKGGLISRVDTLPGPTRFEADATPHDHFWCATCRSVANVRRVKVPKIDLPGVADRLAITYVGQCDACRPTTPAP